MLKTYTIKELVERAKKGKYGFNSDYVLKDNRVMSSYGDLFIDNIRKAVIDYAEWQLDIIKNYGRVYGDKVCGEVCNNIQKQFTALKQFEEDWNNAKFKELLDQYSVDRKLKNEAEQSTV